MSNPRIDFIETNVNPADFLYHFQSAGEALLANINDGPTRELRIVDFGTFLHELALGLGGTPPNGDDTLPLMIQGITAHVNQLRQEISIAQKRDTAHNN